MKESKDNMRFKKSKRSAYRSRRSPQLAPGLPQAPLVEGRDEDFHGVDSVHFPTVCNLISQQCRQPLYRSSEAPDAVVRLRTIPRTERGKVAPAANLPGVQP